MWTIRTRVEVEAARALIRSSFSGSRSLLQKVCMAEYRASLLGKCLNRSASETPAASASDRVVVPWNPLSANTRRTDRMIASRRSSPESFPADFMKHFPSVVCGEFILTHRKGQGRRCPWMRSRA